MTENRNKEDILILVDEEDNSLGYETKSIVHELGLRHRAFSIFIFNRNNEMLLQRRASRKYHSAGLWTNTCCGHPVKGEDVLAGAKRRLMEEMNMEADLSEVTVFQYKVLFENGLIENEVDHIFYAESDDTPKPNPAEVDEWKYISMENLRKEISTNPGNYTEWFKMILDAGVVSKIE
jgi:isopentenyl-diphosphate delta-isomerase